MKKRTFVVLATLIVVVLATAACEPTPTPVKPTPVPEPTPTAVAPTPTPPLLPKGTIYFQGLLENKPWSIYKLNIETGTIELVVENAQEPDVHGGKIVFRRWDSQKRSYDAWVFTGGKQQKLTDNEPGILLSYPRWSPDGMWIAFETDCSDCEVCAAEKTGIEVVSADGEKREVVLPDPNCKPDPYSFTLPTWDRNDLILRTFYGDPLWSRLERLDTKTGKREIVTEGVSSFDIFEDRIVYSTCGPQEGSPIFILEEGQSRRIGEEIGDWPAWSPDGNWIVFNKYGETSYLIIEPVKGLGTGGKTFTISGYATRPIWVWE